MVTKKDFQATADILAQFVRKANNAADVRTLADIAGAFARHYQGENGRFDASRFYAACGFKTGSTGNIDVTATKTTTATLSCAKCGRPQHEHIYGDGGTFVGVHGCEFTAKAR